MPNPRAIKVAMKAAAVLAFVGLFALWANYKIHRIPIPKREKLADCTSKRLSFPLTFRYHPPYQFLLGVSYTSPGAVDFRGEIELRQATGTVTRILISSDQLTECDWLDREPGIKGYILTWSRTNRGDQLSDILVTGQTYDVRVAFSQDPPRGISLWLSSMGKVGEP